MNLPDNRWLLPDGIEEILPSQARRLETLRGIVLRLFDLWGYELVIPPMVDFLESLLTGTGHDLELKTFKLVDPLSGRTLGVRADMTPQVARIDAHNLKRDWPVRLCYLGTVLHTTGDHLDPSRCPMQVGAELYGHDGLESDLEVIRLMLESLAVCRVQQVHLDLGHVGIYEQLANRAGLDEAAEAALFGILQRKAVADLDQQLQALGVATPFADAIRALVRLNGGPEVLPEARQALALGGQAVLAALDQLERTVLRLRSMYPALPVHLDLAELRGYHYQTGLVFAAFVPGYGREIARGGRYDDIGKVFGRARPATGFSADLRVVARLSELPVEIPETVLAPWADDQDLHEAIRDLRACGLRVVQELPGQAKDTEVYTLRLERRDGRWQTVPMDR